MTLITSDSSPTPPSDSHSWPIVSGDAIDLQMRQWRHWLHQHPELAFVEQQTSDYIVDALQQMGYQTHQGMAETGVVASLSVGSGKRSIALRADIDALPVLEQNEFAHKSLHQGKMHACGHDGHAAMLLGAAAYLQQTPDFNGRVHFIFQPAEEGGAGADKMIKAGLFQQFPCEEVYGLHNWPGIPAGEFAIHQREVMAATETFSINVLGHGGHAAMPSQTVDPIVIAAHITTALQTIVSRNVAPVDSVVISVTTAHAGEANNVIAESMQLTGTLRYFDTDLGLQVKQRMQSIIEGIAASMGGSASLAFIEGYPATINDSRCAMHSVEAVQTLVPDAQLHRTMPPSMGAEDFAYMLKEKPGSYIWLGNGEGHGGCMLHNSHYDFNNEVLALGASYWVRLVQQRLA